jgi:hypothetical protein
VCGCWLASCSSVNFGHNTDRQDLISWPRGLLPCYIL